MSSRWMILPLLLVTLLFSACTPAQPTPAGAPAAEVAADAPADTRIPAEAISIRFAMQAADQPLTCTQGATGLGLSQNEVQFNDLRFYVSNIALLNTAGDLVPVALEQNMWQSGATALLDFEDGSAGCADSGNAELNSAVTGTVTPGDYTGIQFELGIPASANHQDVTVAPSPLNIPAMWWNWQGGYKFIRVDMKVAGQEDAPTGGAWFIHLGSTGCASANESTPPTTACTRPNLATIRLEGFDAAQNVIVADMATLLAQVDLTQSVPMPPGCMSGADDPDCIALLPAFGLDVATGACLEEDCPTQTLFRVQ